MKKSILLALSMLLIGSSLIFAGTFGAGVSVGGSMSFVGTDPSGDGTPRYGFTGGLYGDYGFYSIENVVDFSVQPGVYFAMKGYRSEITSPGAADMTANFNYVEVPVLVKATIPLQMAVKPYLLVGPSVGYVVTNEVEMDPAAYQAVGDAVSDSIQSLDYGVVFGAGVDLDMGIAVDARFNLGLANITDLASYEYMRNRSVSLMVSYNLF